MLPLRQCPPSPGKPTQGKRQLLLLDPLLPTLPNTSGSISAAAGGRLVRRPAAPGPWRSSLRGEPGAPIRLQPGSSSRPLPGSSPSPPRLLPGPAAAARRRHLPLGAAPPFPGVPRSALPSSAGRLRRERAARAPRAPRATNWVSVFGKEVTGDGGTAVCSRAISPCPWGEERTRSPRSASVEVGTGPALPCTATPTAAGKGRANSTRHSPTVLTSHRLAANGTVRFTFDLETTHKS